MHNATGLVMTGGGARGAYQAGVLKRIGEIRRFRTRSNPFPIITGASAGAINGAAIAAGSSDFRGAAAVLARLWSGLTPSEVFRCDLRAQTRNSLTWIMDLTFGGLTGGGNARSLLDATPLNNFLHKHLGLRRIQANINKGNLYALAISATNYTSGKSYLFVQGREGHPVWNRSRRVTLSTRITVEHICASAAIPLIFQPVRLETGDGVAWYGDGCVRLQNPLSPAIRLGARKLLAIGVRCERLEHQVDAAPEKEPALAQILGVLLNAIFLDHLVTDVEHLERLNRMLCAGQIKAVRGNGSEPMRPLATLLITPSVNLSELAEEHRRDMPVLIQYFVSSLGRDPGSCADLMSYLLFTSGYEQALVDTGYKDAAARIDEIEDFLCSPGRECDE